MTALFSNTNVQRYVCYPISLKFNNTNHIHPYSKHQCHIGRPHHIIYHHITLHISHQITLQKIITYTVHFILLFYLTTHKSNRETLHSESFFQTLVSFVRRYLKKKANDLTIELNQSSEIKLTPLIITKKNWKYVFLLCFIKYFCGSLI
jgi:hypothetical protein